jgi:hypothetical protein
MNNLSLQKECIEKILKSEEFSGSHIYQTYLTYLLEAKANEKSLKEITIAIEFFGKSSDFNPAEDAIVRSHTYILRKKLETYYLKEGKNDRFRVKIPKGHYEVEIVPASEEKFSFKLGMDRLWQHKIWILVTAVLLILTTTFWIRNISLQNDLKKYQVINKNDPVWSDYISSKIPILIAVGNHFFFNEDDKEFDNLLAIRDGNINSLEDLEILKSKYPDKNLRPADEPYFPYHSIWSLPPVLSLLFSYQQKPILRKASALSAQILDEYNIIYVGSIKTLYILRHTLLKSHFNYKISPHQIEYVAPDSTSSKLFKTSLHSAGPNEDLVLALKLPGPGNNSIFIIASYHSLGSPEIANYLTTPSTLKDLEKKFQAKYGKMPQYFETLFRVVGIDKTAYTTELLIFGKIVRENEPETSP